MKRVDRAVRLRTGTSFASGRRAMNTAAFQSIVPCLMGGRVVADPPFGAGAAKPSDASGRAGAVHLPQHIAFSLRRPADRQTVADPISLRLVGAAGVACRVFRERKRTPPHDPNR